MGRKGELVNADGYSAVMGDFWQFCYNSHLAVLATRFGVITPLLFFLPPVVLSRKLFKKGFYAKDSSSFMV
jgi:hypothetical protein